MGSNLVDHFCVAVFFLLRCERRQCDFDLRHLKPLPAHGCRIFATFAVESTTDRGADSFEHGKGNGSLEAFARRNTLPPLPPPIRYFPSSSSLSSLTLTTYPSLCCCLPPPPRLHVYTLPTHPLRQSVQRLASQEIYACSSTDLVVYGPYSLSDIIKVIGSGTGSIWHVAKDSDSLKVPLHPFERWLSAHKW